MVNYKEILRLNHEGYSQRQIEASVDSSMHAAVRIIKTMPTKHKKCRNLSISAPNYVPGRARTAGSLLRRQILYPTEVQRHIQFDCSSSEQPDTYLVYHISPVISR